MLSNMASSLIKHKRIETTTAKAKALKRYIEPLITRSKDDTTHSRRVVFSHLQDKDAVTELFRDVASKVADRPGGYTRIIKLGHRVGDSADMCLIELVDFNENLLSEKAASRKSAGRRRRGAGKKKTDVTAVADVADESAVAEEAVADESAVEEEAPVEEAVADVSAEVEEAVAEEEEVAEEEPKAEAAEEDVSAEAEKSEDEEPDADDTKKDA